MPWRRAALRAHTLFSREPFWPEPWSGLACLLWVTISVCSAGEVTARQGFVMLDFVAARVWEFLGVCVGAFQLTAVIREHVRWRMWAAFFASAYWLLLTLAIIHGDASAPSWAVYLCFALPNLVSGAALASRRYG